MKDGAKLGIGSVASNAAVLIQFNSVSAELDVVIEFSFSNLTKYCVPKAAFHVVTQTKIARFLQKRQMRIHIPHPASRLAINNLS